MYTKISVILIFNKNGCVLGYEFSNVFFRACLVQRTLTCVRSGLKKHCHVQLVLKLWVRIVVSRVYQGVYLSSQLGQSWL